LGALGIFVTFFFFVLVFPRAAPKTLHQQK
jgi:hypothetical protein